MAHLCYTCVCQKVAIKWHKSDYFLTDIYVAGIYAVYHGYLSLIVLVLLLPSVVSFFTGDTLGVSSQISGKTSVIVTL